MCTLTWTSQRAGEDSPPDPEESGYSLWFNRDELLTRGPEIPPRIQTSPEGVRYIAPGDSEAGGTWIAANEHGLTVALLNGYIVSRGPTLEHYQSRGALVRLLASLERPLESLAMLSPHELAPYRPAVVVLKAPGDPALVARWDGLTVAIDVSGERQLPLTSSSFEQDEVQLSRRALYTSLVLGGEEKKRADAPDPERLAAFQRHVDAERGPTAFTPTMQRADAATRSQCHIVVTKSNVHFEYRPGPPHATEVSVALDLPRSGA
ncbi:hypothetical protein Poly30_24780 [Planctomycetes bacterium Poly30]|uniref:NRDE family protein n=1 Tax=Saltatorellus ferox TaxID=2528018 RepID=A0A518ES91_9BACT|nr:hypothetical protein Poly30_24780 [Planctomycetes bacterium Poly30]